jgi:hypothetical protein
MYSYAQVKFAKNEWCQKKNQKNNLCTDFNSVWWKCCMMFACLFDDNLFALLLFEGICHSNSKNESISDSLQRATLGAGLQSRTLTMSGAWSWHAMSES